MRLNTFAAALCLFATCAHADATEDDNAKLRAEVQSLKERNEALQRMCVVSAGAPASTSTPAQSPVPVVAAPNAAAVASTPAPVLATPAAPAAAEKAPASATRSLLVNKKPYANAGCDRSLFSGPQHGLWQKVSNWKGVTKGSSIADAEAALGPEHYDVDQGDGKLQWEYGSCGSSWEAAVVFQDGVVVSATPPDQ